MSRSIPSVISGFPARPIPATLPSLMPMSALTTPMVGSTTSAPNNTTSSSEAVEAESLCVSRLRRFLVYPLQVSSPASCRSRSTRSHRSVSPTRTRSSAVSPYRVKYSDRDSRLMPEDRSIERRSDRRSGQGRPHGPHREPSRPSRRRGHRGGTRRQPADRTEDVGWCDRTGSARRRGWSCAMCSPRGDAVAPGRQPTPPAGCQDALHPVSTADSFVLSGSIRTMRRVPSARSTSRRTSSSSSGTPSRTSSSRSAERPASSTWA